MTDADYGLIGQAKDFAMQATLLIDQAVNSLTQAIALHPTASEKAKLTATRTKLTQAKAELT